MFHLFNSTVHFSQAVKRSSMFISSSNPGPLFMDFGAAVMQKLYHL